MKLREALDTYMFDNVGQFGGIAESLGYQTEYRDGYFRFRKDGEELSMSVSEIREKAGAKYDESLRDQSKERVSALFDKERANDPKYVAELEKDGISIKRWENLKGHDKDGFTVIDHRLKVCYTGQSLYEYAYKQGNILDGKGTKLEKGVILPVLLHQKENAWGTPEPLFLAVAAVQRINSVRSIKQAWHGQETRRCLAKRYGMLLSNP